PPAPSSARRIARLPLLRSGGRFSERPRRREDREGRFSAKIPKISKIAKNADSTASAILWRGRPRTCVFARLHVRDARATARGSTKACCSTGLRLRQIG